MSRSFTAHPWRAVAAIAACLSVALDTAAQPSDTFEPVTDAMLQKPDPADWLMWRRTLDSWGYSPLREIDTRNVQTLRLVWTRALGPGMQEGTPLVHSGVMYFPNPSDVIQALDAANGQVLWEINLGSPVSGYPVTFAVAGNQYVAVSTGSSLTALGANRLTPELAPSLGNNLFVFALPDRKRAGR